MDGRSEKSMVSMLNLLKGKLNCGHVNVLGKHTLKYLGAKSPIAFELFSNCVCERDRENKSQQHNKQ